MPAFYLSSIREFLPENVERILGILIAAESKDFYQHLSKQTGAWEDEIAILKVTLSGIATDDASALEWGLLLEYPIPRRQKRIDAVLLAHDAIFVIEFKVGAKTFDSLAKQQVEDYALDVHDFHASSRNCVIVPVLVATQAKLVNPSQARTSDFVQPLHLTNSSNLARTLSTTYSDLQTSGSAPIDAATWNASYYVPVPTVIEAAEALFAGQNVREITSSYASVTNLTTTTDRLIEEVEKAQAESHKVICFVTGIPGAGKTLTGLNLVHNPILRESNRQTAAFLSGNGPLVNIVREALARNHHEQTSQPLKQARHEASVFIQNVHTFLDHAATQKGVPPLEHVVVFDEAQRAWDADKQLKKYKRVGSEPAMMLSVMDRHQDWAVIVALVGGGQEIHNGEAGLAEWGKALNEGFTHWQVVASPEVITGGVSLAGHHLFKEGVPANIILRTDPSLHLNISIRSFKAESVTRWVDAVLTGNAVQAAGIAATIKDYPMALTRSLVTARQWLHDHTRGLRRCGLVASSEAKRLRPYGIEVTSQFRRGLSYEDWFLRDVGDIRSSYQLEIAATEFDCQGLELDWVGVCWDADLLYDNNRHVWAARRLSGNRWTEVRDQTNQQYWLNKYRVLMTRAREGFIIWVPSGDELDHTRSPRMYDSIAHYLKACGLHEI